MVPSYEHLGIRYGVAEASDLDEVASFLGAVFAANDPLALTLGVTPGEFEELARCFASGAGDDGLSIVARRAYTGELVGALVSTDGSAPPPNGLERLSPKFAPVFDLLGGLDAEYRRSMAAPPPLGIWLHLLLLGVPEPFGGRDVGSQLLACCLENAMRRGYRVVSAEATHGASQHILRKQGFVDRVRRSYQEYRFHGTAVFASIEGHSGPLLMERVLA
jgi:GNAT superfamily N-acetyltransferase